MNITEAHQILNAAKDGADIPRGKITTALLRTGDLVYTPPRGITTRAGQAQRAAQPGPDQGRIKRQGAERR